MRLVPITQLIALKLYAGGHKSKADIVELLARNPDLDMAELHMYCARYRLSGLDELIAEDEFHDLDPFAAAARGRVRVSAHGGRSREPAAGELDPGACAGEGPAAGAEPGA